MGTHSRGPRMRPVCGRRERREGDGGWWISRERRGGRATSTLKQEDWNKRLAWPREGKARAGPEVEKKRRRNRWGRGSVCGCWYGAQSCFAHHLPSSRDPTPFRDSSTWPIFGFLCSRRFFYFNVLLLFISLYLPLPSRVSLSLPRSLPFCSLTSAPSAAASPTVRQHSDVVCLDVPLLCSRRWLDNFADVICDLTSRNMHRGQLVPRQTGKLISL